MHKSIPRQNRSTITQVMESRSADFGSHTETHWKYEKMEHKNGLKFGPSLKGNI